MGAWNYGFLRLLARRQPAWLAGQGSNYQVVETSGSYTIQNYEGRPAGVKTLKVRRARATRRGCGSRSRQNTGLYSSMLNATLFTGALIHYQDGSTGGLQPPARFHASDVVLQRLGPAARPDLDRPLQQRRGHGHGRDATAMTVAVNTAQCPA